MRVIHLLRKYDPAEWGGTETAVQRLFEGLRQHGVTPIMYCPRLKRPDEEKLNDQSAAVTDRLRANGCDTLHMGRSSCGDASLHPEMNRSADSRQSLDSAVRRFRACVPIWGISRAQRRQLLAVGGNLMSFDLMPTMWGERDAALIHTHTLGRLGSIAGTVARARRLPFVVSIHGGLFDLPEPLKSGFQETSSGGCDWGKVFGALLRSRELVTRADAILTCNPNEAALIQQRYPEKRVRVQPHGIATASYQQDHRAAALAAFPQLQGRQVLLCAGRIDPVKNQGWLIAQAPEVVKRHPEVMFVFAGPCTDQDYGQQVQRQISELGMERHILLAGGFPPADPRLIGLFQIAQSVVLPSISETFGLVLLEAWAAGTAVISSRTSGACSLVKPGENGWLFELNDPRTFHEAANQALSNPELRAKHAAAGRELVLSEYDQGAIGAHVKQLYQELIEEKHALCDSARR